MAEQAYTVLRVKAWDELIANNGAILIWQSSINTVDWEWLIDCADAILDADNDLIVHPMAHRLTNGAYTMDEDEAQDDFNASLSSHIDPHDLT